MDPRIVMVYDIVLDDNPSIDSNTYRNVLGLISANFYAADFISDIAIDNACIALICGRRYSFSFSCNHILIQAFNEIVSSKLAHDWFSIYVFLP